MRISGSLTLFNNLENITFFRCDLYPYPYTYTSFLSIIAYKTYTKLARNYDSTMRGYTSPKKSSFTVKEIIERKKRNNKSINQKKKKKYAANWNGPCHSGMLLARTAFNEKVLENCAHSLLSRMRWWNHSPICRPPNRLIKQPNKQTQFEIRRPLSYFSPLYATNYVKE